MFNMYKVYSVPLCFWVCVVHLMSSIMFMTLVTIALLISGKFHWLFGFYLYIAGKTALCHYRYLYALQNI